MNPETREGRKSVCEREDKSPVAAMGQRDQVLSCSFWLESISMCQNQNETWSTPHPGILEACGLSLGVGLVRCRQNPEAGKLAMEVLLGGLTATGA